MERNYHRVCQSEFVLECVVNISEGRDRRLLSSFDEVCGDALLDRHSDPDHHRSVYTLLGVEAVRALTEIAVENLDLNEHAGVHPRLGVVDVVPFVPLHTSTIDDANAARADFARWLDSTLSIPSFLYGAERSLPDVRRHAWTTYPPDVGPRAPHPTAGATCVGAREQLVAYNCWLEVGTEFDVARVIANRVRQPCIRSLALRVGQRVQVSMNLVAPLALGPYDAVRAVEDACHEFGVRIAHNELVGLLSADVLKLIPHREWKRLDVSEDRTIESRMNGGR